MESALTHEHVLEDDYLEVVMVENRFEDVLEEVLMADLGINDEIRVMPILKIPD